MINIMPDAGNMHNQGTPEYNVPPPENGLLGAETLG